MILGDNADGQKYRRQRYIFRFLFSEDFACPSLIPRTIRTSFPWRLGVNHRSFVIKWRQMCSKWKWFNEGQIRTGVWDRPCHTAPRFTGFYPIIRTIWNNSKIYHSMTGSFYYSCSETPVGGAVGPLDDISLAHNRDITCQESVWEGDHYIQEGH